VILLLLKDLGRNGVGQSLTISGSNQENRSRAEGMNIVAMKAFASATGDLNRMDYRYRNGTPPKEVVRGGEAPATHGLRVAADECPCRFCRCFRYKPKGMIVAEEYILYKGTYQDLGRIAGEVAKIPYGGDEETGKKMIAIVGLTSIAEFAEAEFTAENHGETDVDPFDDKLCPFPVMLDVPTKEELEISREWRDYISLEEIPAEVRKGFEKTLDKHKSVFAYGPNEVRFVKEDGKTAELDLEMESDKPMWTKPFGLAGPVLEKLEIKIEELLQAGLIEPIKTNWNSPVFMVPHNSAAKNEKAEERKYRMIVDLRVVNSLVKFSNRYSYLVKGIEFAMEKLRGKKYFTVLDMNKAYRSLKVSPRTQEICSFIVPNSTKWPTQSFAFKSLIDGLNLGPGYYSYLINKALSYESRKATMIHIDDVCIASESLEQHLKDIDAVLGDLNASGFMVAAAKACFYQEETRFLGHRISLNQITIDEKRKALFRKCLFLKQRKR
jgi:hypothetical protein